MTIPSGVLTGVSDLTIAAWVKLDSAAPWSRVFDVGHAPDRWSFLTRTGAAAFRGTSSEAPSTTAAFVRSWFPRHAATDERLEARRGHVFGVDLPDVHRRVSGGVRHERAGHLALRNGASRARVVVGKVTFWRRSGSRWGPRRAAHLRARPQPVRGRRRRVAEGRLLVLALRRRRRGDDRRPSDNAIPTTLVGGATWTATGRLGWGSDLPGGAPGATGPYVALADNPLKSCTSELTVASWLRVHALTSWSRLFDFGTTTSTFIYLAPTDGAGMHFARLPRAAARTSSTSWRRLLSRATTHGTMSPSRSPRTAPSPFTSTSAPGKSWARAPSSSRRTSMPSTTSPSASPGFRTPISTRPSTTCESLAERTPPPRFVNLAYRP